MSGGPKKEPDATALGHKNVYYILCFLFGCVVKFTSLSSSELGSVKDSPLIKVLQEAHLSGTVFLFLLHIMFHNHFSLLLFLEKSFTEHSIATGYVILQS